MRSDFFTLILVAALCALCAAGGYEVGRTATARQIQAKLQELQKLLPEGKRIDETIKTIRERLRKNK